MSNPKSFADESPFLQGETPFARPEEETSFDLRQIETPFLSAEPAQNFLQTDEETLSEEEIKFDKKRLLTFTAKTLPLKVSVYVTRAAQGASQPEVLVFIHGKDVCDPQGLRARAPEKFITQAPFKLGDHVESSARPIVLVVPFLDWENLKAKDTFGNAWHPFAKPEAFNGVVAEALERASDLAKTAKAPARLILAGHSRAWAVFDALANAQANPEMKKGALGRLRDVWALDTTYTSPVADWTAWIRGRADLRVTIAYRDNAADSLDTGIEGRKFLALTATIKDRLSVIPVPSNGVGHCEMPGTYLPLLLRYLSPTAPAKTEHEWSVEQEEEQCRCKDEEIVESELPVAPEASEEQEEQEEEEDEADFAELDVLEESEEPGEREDYEITEEERDSYDEVVSDDAELFEGENGDGGKRRFIILAAGIEFPKYHKHPKTIAGKKWWTLAHNKPDAGNWRRECLELAETRLKKDPDLVVCLYDFFRATLELVTLDKGKTVATISRQFSPLVPGDYRWLDGDTASPDTLLRQIPSKALPVAKYPERPVVRYCPSVSTISGEPKQGDWIAKFNGSKWDDHGLSVRHIYEHIQKIGTDHPYTLKEFHSFGHASSGAYPVLNGTAFVNTTHIRGPKTQSLELDDRHPLDLDPRAGLDFKKPTMDVKKFRMAFAKDARSYVWGCNWDVPVFRMLESIRVSLGSKKLTDDLKFKFPWRGEKEQFDKLIQRAGCTGVTWKNGTPPTVTLDGKCVTAIFTMLRKDTYVQQLANASTHCVTGGLPGTSSDHDSKSEKGGPKLSHIPMRVSSVPLKSLYCVPRGDEKCDQSFLGALRFYQKHFGVAFDPEGAHADFGRGYALYCPET